MYNRIKGSWGDQSGTNDLVLSDDYRTFTPMTYSLDECKVSRGT